MRGSDARTDTVGRGWGGRWGVAAALVGVLSLTACGSGGDDGAGGAPDDASAEGPEDPRVGPDFSEESAVTLTEHHASHGEAVVTEDTAYLADHGGLTAYDLDTGDERFRVEPSTPGLDAYTAEDVPDESRAAFRSGLSSLADPRLVDVDGTEAVLAAHLVGPGDALEVSLLAADAETGDELWSTEIRSDILGEQPIDPTVWVGEAHEGHVTVTLSEGDFMREDTPLQNDRYVVELDSGDVVQELGDTVVVGHANGTLYTVDRPDDETFGDLVGRDPASGSERWRLDLSGANPVVVGPWIVATEQNGGTRLLDAEDHDTVLTVEEWLQPCTFDPEAAMLACVGDERIVGVDADGEVAWTVPTDSYAWVALHGGYLYTIPEDDVVALDVTTGETVSDSVRAEPAAVGPTGALFLDDMTVSFHPAD